ncbi:DUF1036 domain-containing protein [Sorangium sp. So ce726]|uniref:DUF1036 domain-containing protein n=1 Tax=Sorangium sp. So ce726 TaxID=3133319 RepID=UPI003F626BE2
MLDHAGCAHGSHEQISTAVVHAGDQPGQGPVSRGWWNLAPGECAVAVVGSVWLQPLWVHARSTSSSRRWGSVAKFCVESSAFTIYNADVTTGCAEVADLDIAGSFTGDDGTYSFRP